MTVDVATIDPDTRPIAATADGEVELQVHGEETEGHLDLTEVAPGQEKGQGAPDPEIGRGTETDHGHDLGQKVRILVLQQSFIFHSHCQVNYSISW